MPMSNVIEPSSESATRVADTGIDLVAPDVDYLTSRTLPDDDPLTAHHWYVFYVTYQRELKVKAELDAYGFETFIPMRSRLTNHAADDASPDYHNDEVPAIHNLIFVRAFYPRLRWMKMYNPVCCALQFLKVAPDDHRLPEQRYIPLDQMQQFIRASMEAFDDSRAKFLVPDEARAHIGKPVRFIRGKYAGIKGTLRRIDKNRMVVLDLQGIVTLALPIGHIAEVEIL